MSPQDRDSVLQAAAKALTWELFAAAGYGRLRTPISVEKFDQALRGALRLWSTTQNNLNPRKEK